MRRAWGAVSLLALAVFLAGTPSAESACCYFSAKDKDILQPAQKAFLTWDPQEKVETFTVQPKFEGNAQDFGMVIPTPSQPKLHEMPRDFFKHLAIYSVMKKDTMQMKRNKDGTFAGEVTPTRFQFASEKLVYPLKITQISVKDKTEALFYVQAPTKMDLTGDNSYQYTWIPMLQAGRGCTPGGLPGRGEQWLK